VLAGGLVGVKATLDRRTGVGEGKERKRFLNNVLDQKQL
jgi:hypothetical protein